MKDEKPYQKYTPEELKSKYCCDQCGKVLKTEHISLKLGTFSGYRDHTASNQWTHTHLIYGILKVCDRDCLYDYFDPIKFKAKGDHCVGKLHAGANASYPPFCTPLS